MTLKQVLRLNVINLFEKISRILPSDDCNAKYYFSYISGGSSWRTLCAPHKGPDSFVLTYKF